MGFQAMGESESIEQWPDPAPWSPIPAAETNVDSLAGIRTFPPDRSYPDKIEEELDELGKVPDTASDEDQEEKRKTRRRRVRKRRGHQSTSRGNERDKRGGGGGGGGGNSHGIRVR